MPRSATHSRPFASNISACGVRNSPWRTPIFPHDLTNLPSARELADPGRGAALEALFDRLGGGHALGVVAVRDVDAAVGPDDDVVRLVELAVGVAGLAGDAEAHQLLALRAELVHLVALGALLVAREVGDPHVALPVHVDAVRGHHGALADVRQRRRRSRRSNLKTGIDRVVLAVDRAAAGRARAAALVAPDVAVVRIDVEAGGGAPLAAGGQLTPVLGHVRRRVRQPFAGDGVRHNGGAGSWASIGRWRPSPSLPNADPQEHGAGTEGGEQNSRHGTWHLLVSGPIVNRNNRGLTQEVQ